MKCHEVPSPVCFNCIQRERDEWIEEYSKLSKWVHALVNHLPRCRICSNVGTRIYIVDSGTEPAEYCHFCDNHRPTPSWRSYERLWGPYPVEYQKQLKDPIDPKRDL